MRVTRSWWPIASVHATATTPLRCGSHSIADTTMFLEYVRCVKDCSSEMMASLRLPLTASSSASAAKSSSNTFVISFSISASSNSPAMRSKNLRILRLLHSSAFAVASSCRGSHCVARGRHEVQPACAPASAIGGTACTLTSFSMRRRSKLGSLNGRHSIWLEFHSSAASLSESDAGALNARRGRCRMTATGSRRAITCMS
mmetsp:Transcript_39725/g.118219  ORF Transcript_39725/g.118219 Transcript_39725/m.118219 type:complete len:201 (+) Transcript_39725:2218-2820(+)